MSSEAITARFRKVDELRRLCLSLAKAKLVDAAAGVVQDTRPLMDAPANGNPSGGDPAKER